jgi:multiple sugar transport system substrate-binding protein
MIRRQTRRALAGQLRAAGIPLAAGSVGAGLTACSVGQSGDTAPAGGAARAKPNTTLQWMYWSTPGPWLEANQKEAAAFEARYAPQGLKIEQLNVASGRPFLDKLSALVAGGTPPDVAEIMPWDVPQFQGRRLLLNLSPMIKRDKYDLGDFFAAGFDQYRWTADGKPGAGSGADLYGVPRDFPTRAVVYNVDAFKEVGARLPAALWSDTTWNQVAFVETCQRLIKRDAGGANGIGRWAWSGHEGLQEWMPWVFNNGGDFVSADGRESRFDQPKTIEAFQFLADLQHRQGLAPTPAQRQTEGAMDQAFFNGRLAMMHFGPAQLGRYRQTINGFEWDVAVFPHSGPGSAVGSGSGWIVMSGTRDPEASWLLTQHLLSAETQRTDAEAGSGVPARRSTMEQVFIKQPTPPKNVRVFLENAGVARIIPQVARWTEMMEIVDRELPSIWRGEKTARDVCLEIKRQVDQVLK